MPTNDCQPESPETLIARLLELEQKVRALEADLERTHRLATLGTIASSIAHEFNNILTPVLSYAHMALAAPDDRVLASKALQKAADGTQKAAEIASAMLGFVRDNDACDRAEVEGVVRDAVSCLGCNLAKEGIELVVSIPDGCIASIRPVALHQVVLNLLLNAMEAVKPSQGRIEVTAKWTDRSTWNSACNANPTPESESPRGVIIRVSDTGRGISPDVLDRVFEPLVSSRGEAGSRKGTGLGLSICKRLVAQAGGTITVQSEPGNGTTFEISLNSMAAASRTSAAA